MKESLLFPTIKKWLESKQYTAHDEVPFPTSPSAIDVVGIDEDNNLICIELKQTLNQKSNKASLLFSAYY